MTINRILKYYNTLKYLKLVQTAGRFYSTLKKNHYRHKSEEDIKDIKYGLNFAVPFIYHDPWNCMENIKKGNFRFLNREKQFPDGRIDWESKEMPLLWRFNLNYFAYLHLLEMNEKLEICKDWIRQNKEENTAGWHSYPLSLRIVNWIKAGINDPAIIKSIYCQASYLYNNLEIYHPGNHLLENARALIFAGVYFKDSAEANRWLKKGIKILKKELPLQVLSDGGYFERSTMYHALMFELVLDIINILPEGQEEFRKQLQETAEKMSTFLFSMTHPDNKIALFNDSTFEIANGNEALLEYYYRLTGNSAAFRQIFSDSGYYVYRDLDIYLAIDGGPIGPDYIPAHAHADIFSYELSLFSKRIIIDSGVYEYPAGQMRSYVRSTRAHNTVNVDDKDQAECWDSFRVARRYRPENVAFDRDRSYCKFSGEFKGYASLIGDGILHKREIICDGTGRTILVDDYIKGKGRHTVNSYIHFSPHVKIQFVDNVIVLTSDNKKIKLIVENGNVRFENGWYCPEFGERIQNQVLVISSESLPARLSYHISF